ncbi:hypothetical protein G6F35_017145 [Rhizopus arrhizus]|nr:hypothetical protein G6F35_017145 [Rhizopus arrhizus]
MQPEVGLPADATTAVNQAQQFLARTAADAQRWSIELPDSRSSATTVSWQPKGEKERRRGQRNPNQATLDADGTPVQANVPGWTATTRLRCCHCRSI